MEAQKETMRTGISTACLYPMEIEKSLDLLLSMDFRLFELFINTSSELDPAFVRMLRTRLEETGAQVKSLHPFTSGFEGTLFFSEYLRRVEDGLEFYKRYFEAAGMLGAKLLVLHGQRGYREGKITEEEYLERYLRLYRLGQRFGIAVAQENVNQFRSEDPEFIARMRGQLGEECAFVFDIKQAVRAGKDPFAMCRAMGERLIHVHINDNAPGADCLLPGCGTMAYEKLLDLLRDSSYAGDLIIEVYRKNFGEPHELFAARERVESLCRSFSERVSG
ncbi:endonuclease [Anaeromassilibacillus sp. An200]|nr:endonuclease [Anaeromassilibacillus sp. An200]